MIPVGSILLHHETGVYGIVESADQREVRLRIDNPEDGPDYLVVEDTEGWSVLGHPGPATGFEQIVEGVLRYVG